MNININVINLRFLLFFFIFCLCNSCKNKSESSDSGITIAVAANMQFAMEELLKAFTADHKDIQTEMIVSSSGKLTAQIKQGAPYDIFVSANMKYPNEIFNSRLSQKPPKVYAYGKLVLWTMADNITPSIEVISHDIIRHLAIANPKTAPYGVAAVQVLKEYGIFDEVEHKIVYGESIAQTNQFITSGAAEIGFTAMSVVLSHQMQGKGSWIEINESDYAPIEQGVVIIDRKNGKKAGARQFYDFLFSDKAKEILKDYGYAVK